MKCPYCGYSESKVIDSRPTDEGERIRRRREVRRELCGVCNLVRRTEKGRLRRRGWGLRWEKAQKGGKGTNLRGFFED